MRSVKGIGLGLVLASMAGISWAQPDTAVTPLASHDLAVQAVQIETTLLFTVILTVFLILLSFRVLDLRGSPVTKWLHPANRQIKPETLDRAIRGQGNLIEYAPMFLILMLCLELQGIPKGQLLVSGTIFTIGRFMHGVVFSFLQPQLLLRIGGMALTFLGFFGLIGSAIPILL
jgi:uncharacterized membrane protein YecN with MAPEG domain